MTVVTYIWLAALTIGFHAMLWGLDFDRMSQGSPQYYVLWLCLYVMGPIMLGCPIWWFFSWLDKKAGP